MAGLKYEQPSDSYLSVQPDMNRSHHDLLKLSKLHAQTVGACSNTTPSSVCHTYIAPIIYNTTPYSLQYSPVL